jgi:hypothetical protein
MWAASFATSLLAERLVNRDRAAPNVCVTAQTLPEENAPRASCASLVHEEVLIGCRTGVRTHAGRKRLR